MHYYWTLSESVHYKNVSHIGWNIVSKLLSQISRTRSRTSVCLTSWKRDLFDIWCGCHSSSLLQGRKWHADSWGTRWPETEQEQKKKKADSGQRLLICSEYRKKSVDDEREFTTKVWRLLVHILFVITQFVFSSVHTVQYRKVLSDVKGFLMN